MDDQRTDRKSGTNELIVRRERINIGGIELELTVRDYTGGYYGACLCIPCHEGGVKYELRATPEAALEVARELAEKHVDETHKK